MPFMKSLFVIYGNRLLFTLIIFISRRTKGDTTVRNGINFFYSSLSFFFKVLDPKIPL